MVSWGCWSTLSTFPSWIRHRLMKFNLNTLWKLKLANILKKKKSQFLFLLFLNYYNYFVTQNHSVTCFLVYSCLDSYYDLCEYFNHHPSKIKKKIKIKLECIMTRYFRAKSWCNTRCTESNFFNIYHQISSFPVPPFIYKPQTLRC